VAATISSSSFRSGHLSSFSHILVLSLFLSFTHTLRLSTTLCRNISLAWRTSLSTTRLQQGPTRPDARRDLLVPPAEIVEPRAYYNIISYTLAPAWTLLRGDVYVYYACRQFWRTRHPVAAVEEQPRCSLTSSYVLLSLFRGDARSRCLLTRRIIIIIATAAAIALVGGGLHMWYSIYARAHVIVIVSSCRQRNRIRHR